MENLSRGRMYSVVKATVERVTGRIVSISSSQVIPTLTNSSAPVVNTNVTLDPEATAYLAPLRAQLQIQKGVILARSPIPIRQTDSCGANNGRQCESPIGNLISDSIRNATGVDFALINSGAIRTALTCISGTEPTCPRVTYPPYPITLGRVCC